MGDDMFELLFEYVAGTTDLIFSMAAVLDEVRFQTDIFTWLRALIDRTAPVISSPTPNCPPIIASNFCGDKGTRMDYQVQAWRI